VTKTGKTIYKMYKMPTISFSYWALTQTIRSISQTSEKAEKHVTKTWHKSHRYHMLNSFYGKVV